MCKSKCYSLHVCNERKYSFFPKREINCRNTAGCRMLVKGPFIVAM